MVQEVSGKTQFETEVLQAEVPVLVDFWAARCGPCRQIAPVLQSLAANLDGARVVKVDVDRNPELATAFRITAIPALVFFKEGREVRRHYGLRSREALQADLEALKRN